MLLSEALLQKAEDRVIAFVGGGGKTSLMFGLAKELASRDEHILVTTTTHIIAPNEDQAQSLILTENLDQIIAELKVSFERHNLVAVGTRLVTADRKMKGIPSEWIEALAKLPNIDRILVEADGSAGRPFKAPAEHEPVIPSVADVVIPVVGIDALGQPIGPDFVHRPDKVADIAGVPLGATITPQIIAKVMLHHRGLVKGTPNGARIVPVINKVDDTELRTKAREIGHLLIEEGARKVVIARAQHQTPVWEVLERR